MTAHFRLSTVGVVLLVAAACSPIRYPTYYLLNVAPSSKPAASKVRRPAAVSVRCFDTPDYIRQGRIVYRDTPHVIGFYDYHRWAADPGATITAALIEAIRSARLFAAVVPYDGREQQEYVLSGRVERLEEIDYKGGVRVEVRLLAQIVDRRAGEAMWTGDETTTSNLETRTVASVVDAMSHAVEMSINRLVESLDREFAAPDRE
jgi:uncharacterized lipoprotein YmbA